MESIYSIAAFRLPAAHGRRSLGVLSISTLGNFDFSATAISKGVCRFCGIIIVIASTVSLIASYVIVKPVLTMMSIPCLVIGAALAIKPEVATRLAEKYLSRRK